jgi:DNA repair exonuclease SbcCD ATPase subunit
METAMTDKPRDTSGKFAPKSETPRRIRSVNLTDDAWQWLAAEAQKASMSRNDYLEVLASGNNPLMETAPPEIEANDASIAQQPHSELSPLMETVGADNQRLHMKLGNSDDRRLYIGLGNFESEKKLLEQELVEVRSQLETERAHRQEIEAELSELKQNSAPAATLSKKLTPDAATILSKLRARRKKSKADLADLEAILEILES